MRPVLHALSGAVHRGGQAGRNLDVLALQVHRLRFVRVRLPQRRVSMQAEHAPVTTGMESVVCKKPPLTPEEQAEKERKEAERAAKIAAAKAKKAATAAETGKKQDGAGSAPAPAAGSAE